MSKMSAHTSSTMFCRRYPQVTTSASRKVSSRGRPSPLSHGSSSRSATQHSSSPSCSSSSPDIRSYRNGFSVVERCGLETSFLSAGEAVACYPVRRGARFFNMSGKSPPYCPRYGVLHNPPCQLFWCNAAVAAQRRGSPCGQRINLPESKHTNSGRRSSPRRSPCSVTTEDVLAEVGLPPWAVTAHQVAGLVVAARDVHGGRLAA